MIIKFIEVLYYHKSVDLSRLVISVKWVLGSDPFGSRFRNDGF